jgi:hypothetical protein
MFLKYVVMGAALAAGIATAGPIVAGITTQTTACLDYNLASKSCSGAGSGTLNNAITGDTLTFTDSATAGYGIMHVATTNSFTVSGGVPGNQAWSYGFADINDQITINSPTKNGQTGWVKVGYLIEGTASSTGVADGFDQVVMRTVVNSVITNNLVDDYHGNVPTQTVYHWVQITYGQLFILYFSMQATGGTAVDLGGGPVGTGGYSFVGRNGTGTANVHFENTFELTGLQTFANDQSTPVGDTSFNSDSGTQYTQGGITPEPSTMLTAAGVLAALAAAGRRRRR